MADQGMNGNGNGLDAFSPAEVAKRVEQVGVVKATMPLYRMAALSVLAGAFIALAGIYFLTATTDVKAGYGAGQVMGGLVFSLGLILVIVAGAELFTGNNLLIMAMVSKKIPLWLVLRNWAIVFTFNMIGAISVAAFAYWGEHWTGGGGMVGARILSVGANKAALPFFVAFTRAVLCNVLVCLAVWLAAAGRSVVDKVVAIIFPISAFVAAGFEHNVANMLFIPYAIWVKVHPEIVAMANVSPEKLEALNWAGYFHNLLPVTLGNIVGGAVLVGFVYWVCYIWDGRTLPRRLRRFQ